MMILVKTLQYCTDRYKKENRVPNTKNLQYKEIDNCEKNGFKSISWSGRDFEKSPPSTKFGNI